MLLLKKPKKCKKGTLEKGRGWNDDLGEGWMIRAKGWEGGR